MENTVWVCLLWEQTTPLIFKDPCDPSMLLIPWGEEFMFYVHGILLPKQGQEYMCVCWYMDLVTFLK